MLKSIRHVFALLPVVAIVPACSENQAADAKTSMQKTYDDAKAKFNEVKDSLAKSTDKTVTALGQDVEVLKQKIANLPAEKKPEIDQALKDIGKAKDELMRNLSELEHASETTFDSVKSKIETGVADLKKLVDDVKNKVK